MTGLCRCGCGEQATRPTALYRPGHDARHAGAVGRALIAAGHADPALLDALPSQALRAKAEAVLARKQPSSSSARPSIKVTATATATGAPDVVPLVEMPAGDSQVQRDAEAVLLAVLSASIGASRSHRPASTSQTGPTSTATASAKTRPSSLRRGRTKDRPRAHSATRCSPTH